MITAGSPGKTRAQGEGTGLLWRLKVKILQPTHPEVPQELSKYTFLEPHPLAPLRLTQWVWAGLLPPFSDVSQGTQPGKPEPHKGPTCLWRKAHHPTLNCPRSRSPSLQSLFYSRNHAVFSRVRLFAIPMDSSPPGSSVHGILQAGILHWGGHFLLQGILPTQGSNPHLPHFLHWQADSFSLSHLGSPGFLENVAHNTPSWGQCEVRGSESELSCMEGSLVCQGEVVVQARREGGRQQDCRTQPSQCSFRGDHSSQGDHSSRTWLAGGSDRERAGAHRSQPVSRTFVQHES